MEHENGLAWVFWIGTFIMSFLAVAVVVLAVVYQRRVLMLQRKESIATLKVALEAEEKERHRIAADLHDGISGDISAVLSMVGVLELKDKDGVHKELIDAAKDALKDTLDNIQRISYNLMPPLLEKQGLKSALMDFFERIEKGGQIKVHQKYLNESLHLTHSEAYELYRVIQELTSNALKHGGATHIEFSIQDKDGCYVFTFKDNGAVYNFDEEAKQATGMGLKNIKIRLMKSQAVLKQEATTGGNTVVLKKSIKL